MKKMFRHSTTYLGVAGLLIHVSAAAATTTTSTTATTVKTAYVDRFETVAQDASIPGSPYVDNSWGSHQPRITSHSDGSIRLLYLSTDKKGNIQWHLMRRNTSGKWNQEKSGPTTDDVALVKDARNDRAHVLAWPSSVPVVYTSPTFSGSTVPGSWQMLASNARHYGNVGISSDGTFCLKASRELSTPIPTSRTNTEYACGNFSNTSGTWNWSAFISHSIGARYSYDYIFPNPDGLTKGMLYATATSDLYKLASDVPTLDPVYGNYVFNGMRVYSTGLNTDASWSNNDTKLESSFSAATATATGTKVSAPMLRLHESFIDSKGRIFSGYYAEDPSNTNIRGMYAVVTDKSGFTLFQSKWTALPTYGYTRMFEDSKKRLWLLWTGQGSQATQVRLYPIIESTASGKVSFTTGNYTDLGASFNPYSIQGSLYIAAPRGGNDKSLFVDAIYNTCWNTYKTGINFDSTQCYNADRSGYQRVFYARIRLPD